MAKYQIITTLSEDSDKKFNKYIYVGDCALPLEKFRKIKNINPNHLFKENRKKLFYLNKKIIDIIYKEYKIFYKSNISKKSFFLLVSPFIFTFLDVIRNKNKTLSYCKKKFKSLQFASLDENNFFYPKSFSEFLSNIQSDQFNLQLNTEIIKYKNFNNKKIKIYNSLKNKFFNLLKKNIKLKNLKEKNFIYNHKKLIMNKNIIFHKIDYRHKYALGKILKKNKNYRIFDDNKFKLNDLVKIEKNNNLRNQILKSLLKENQEVKFFSNLLIKYLPSLYLESIEENIINFSDKIKRVPFKIISNAHGWWANDCFKFYLATCLNNNSKYIDIQHNGTYFIFDDNVHFNISSLFRDKFIGWGQVCEKFSNCSSLPALYSIQKSKPKVSNGNKIILMSANISRFFEGYRNSYLSGGQNLKYFNNQILFLEKINSEIQKHLIIRARFNVKDPNDYSSYLKKKFKKIKIETIKKPAFDRLNKPDIKIIVVDHCSTPWLEALFLNKPLIMFWDRNINVISKEFLKLFEELRSNNILFDDPQKAVARLNSVYSFQTDWWYSNKIQKLRKKILNLFFIHNKEAINMWNNRLTNIISS